jgi:ribosomal protein S18 acetylase RimI-like enzyme
MEYILDNPAWHALSSGNKDLANGNETAKYFAREVSPFVGINEPTISNFNKLYETIPFAGSFGFISPVEIEFPLPWKVVKCMRVLQMTFEGPLTQTIDEKGIVPLNETHIPQMLDLTKLTNPGPFNDRTIDFGHYRGIFDGDRLVAMAGQRMHPYNYAEISAVCTHSDHLGKGYARKLLLNQVERIKAASETPFLHVLADNTRAIKVYHDLGFKTRKEISICIIQK